MVGDEMLKDEFQKACDAILKEGFDLELVYDQNAEYLVKNSVKRRIVRRFEGYRRALGQEI
jgi:hypothetical protein